MDSGDLGVRLDELFSDLEAAPASEGDAKVSFKDLMASTARRRRVRNQGLVFRALADNATDAISVSDLEGSQTYCNCACYEVFGYDREDREMEGLPLANLWPPRQKYMLIDQVLPQAKLGSWRGEVTLKRKDGTLFDAFLTIFPVLDDESRPVSITSVIRDISERKAMEREREQMYERRARQVQLITQVSQEIATAASLEELYRRVVTLVKDRFGYYHVRILRYDPTLDAMVVAESSEPVEEEEIGGDEPPRETGIVVTAAATGQSILISDVSQHLRWVPYPGLPDVRGELAVPIKLDGQLLGVLHVLSEAAGVLNREDEIALLDLAGHVANAVERTRLLEETDILRQFAQASEGIGWITLESHLLIYVNPALCGLLGVARPEDTFGKPIVDYYPSDLRRRVREEVLPTVMREGRWVGELALVSDQGQIIPTVQSVSLVRDHDGRPLYIANVVTDVSRQKEAEALAQRRARQVSFLNDVGRKVEQAPDIAEVFDWVAEQLPQALHRPDACTVSIELQSPDGDGCAVQVDSTAAYACCIEEELRVAGEAVGWIRVAHSETCELYDDERVLMRDVAGRLSRYVEDCRLVEQARAGLQRAHSSHQHYLPARWPVYTPGVPSSEAPPALEEAVPGNGRQTACVRKGRIWATLRKVWQRTATRLLLLALLLLLLTGALLTSRIAAQASPASAMPTPTVPSLSLAALGSSADPAAEVSLADTPVPPAQTTEPTQPALPSPTFTPTPTSSPTFPPASTPTPTCTPTPLPEGLTVPTAFPPRSADAIATAEAVVSHTLPIPTPVQPVPVAADAINIVVLGSDRRPDWAQWHTDAVHVVSIQRGRGVVSLLSIPRDLYLYIPDFWMSRINFADFYGDAYGYGGGGPALVRDTLLYNLGIRVDHYVRTNFDGLIGMVDAVGGVDIPVHCRISDYWPYANEDGEYPILALEPGVHHMDGETALWYARTRKTTSVFSRERRQQQVLQALWHKMRTDVTLAQIPALWEQSKDMVETDMTAGDVLELAGVAFALEDQSARFYNVGPNEVTPWTTPYGGAVFLPQWEAVESLVGEVMSPAPEGRLSRTYMPVQVWNGTSNQDWDRLAADRLWRLGFPAVVGEPDRRDYGGTQLILFSENAKGSGVDYIQRVFGVPADRVIHQPDASSEFGMRLIIGADYQTCPGP